jgi:hypothetical protein
VTHRERAVGKTNCNGSNVRFRSATHHSERIVGLQRARWTTGLTRVASTLREIDDLLAPAPSGCRDCRKIVVAATITAGMAEIDARRADAVGRQLPRLTKNPPGNSNSRAAFAVPRSDAS